MRTSNNNGTCALDPYCGRVQWDLNLEGKWGGEKDISFTINMTISLSIQTDKISKTTLQEERRVF